MSPISSTNTTAVVQPTTRRTRGQSGSRVKIHASVRRFVEAQPQDPGLAAEAGGAFQALVGAVAALQRDAILRGDDTVLMARLVWAVVHGVAMLAIDGQLPEPGAVEELMRYALERLGTGIRAGS